MNLGLKTPRMLNRRDNSRIIRARTGPEKQAKHWTTEAAVRMLQNNLDPMVAEAPEEALAGMTREGARALALQDEVGTISAGKAADLCVWRVSRPAELCYWVGLPGPERRIVAGADS